MCFLSFEFGPQPMLDKFSVLACFKISIKNNYPKILPAPLVQETEFKTPIKSKIVISLICIASTLYRMSDKFIISRVRASKRKTPTLI